jgi:hypothetical protein
MTPFLTPHRVLLLKAEIRSLCVITVIAHLTWVLIIFQAGHPRFWWPIPLHLLLAACAASAAFLAFYGAGIGNPTFGPKVGSGLVHLNLTLIAICLLQSSINLWWTLFDQHFHSFGASAAVTAHEALVIAAAYSGLLATSITLASIQNNRTRKDTPA